MGYIPETYITPAGRKRRWCAIPEALTAAKQEWEPLFHEPKIRSSYDAYKTYTDPRGNKRATVNKQGKIAAGVNSGQWRVGQAVKGGTSSGRETLTWSAGQLIVTTTIHPNDTVTIKGRWTVRPKEEGGWELRDTLDT